MTTRHKHADVIIAWANGAEVECRGQPSRGWVSAPNPSWSEEYEYRVKPSKNKYRVVLFKYPGVEEVIQAPRDMSLYVGEEIESGDAWDSPPKYCPFCGGKNIYNDVALWSSVSEDDQNNKAVLDEHQCQDCGGRSFWA